ncbi:MAG TPA: M14 family zinc carboxypeptidase [Vicinamibacteria bacterium]|nr:M14 family zinc carboxypeptidase [Vicinamibacteria bacterium]
MKVAPLAVAAALAAGTGASASSPDVAEPGSREAIARFTSDPRFVSPWVAYVPESAAVPSPAKHFGRITGAPGAFARSADIYGYFRALAAASPRVKVETIGRSEEGREILLVAVADEEGIRDLDRLKAATAALADPRRTNGEAAESILATARPIYFINAGLHADESSAPEMVQELAYRLAVSDQPMIDQIRRRLVVLINPVSNPDGRDKMADWFEAHLKGRTDFETLPRVSPPYWGPYVFVDVNRDAHQLALETTRAVSRMFFDYHPTVVHDLHEAIPLLMTWNGTGPYNPNLDPIVTSEFLEMSFHEVTTLTALGMPGVWTWKFGEAFGHHYLDSVAMNHNSIGRGYETFGNGSSETMERVLEDDDVRREWYRPLPPPRRFRWSMRDSVNYGQTGLLAILDYSARHAPDLLRNFHRKSWNSWRKGVEGPPYAFVIPAEQGDRARVAEMVNRLRAQQIEVARAAAPFTVEEGTFGTGSFVVPMAQPYRNYAVDLLAPQHFPEDAESAPYDDVSWALPIHYGLAAVPIADVRVRDLATVPLTEDVRASGTVGGAGPNFVLRDTGQEALLAARFRLSGFALEVAEEPFRAGGVDHPAGSWILPGASGLREALDGVAAELGLDFTGVEKVPEVRRHPAPPPRLGVWVPWADTDSIGWIRMALDRRKVPYVYLRDEDVRAGTLRGRVDVILYGHVDLDLQGQIHGIPAERGPLPFRKTEATPSLGTPAASDDITGGPGWLGLESLRRFLAEGGLLVTLGGGSTLALDGGLARFVRRATVDVATPGSELRATFARPDHPVAYGYPKEASVFRTPLPVYDAPRRWHRMAYCTGCLDGPEDRGPIVLEWGVEGRPLVVSGGVRGGERLAGRPALLDLPVDGGGHVLAFNFNPLHRDLNRSDHRLVWNALLNWKAIVGR